jgi:hypothetical protein
LPRCLRLVVFISVALLLASLARIPAQEIPRRIGSWDGDSLGNHRVVLRVEMKEARDAVWAHILWRRRDQQPELKKFIMVDAATGKQLNNVIGIKISREEADIVFQPQTVPGDYFLYYLPCAGSKRSNYPKITYPRPEQTAQSDWLWNNYLSANDLKLKSWTVLPRAQVVAMESIDSLNSFWPMEVIALKSEVDSLAAANPGSTYLVFPEDRSNPIKMRDDLPARWIALGPGGPLKGIAMRGEYFTFQLGLFAMRRSIDSLALAFSDCTSGEITATLPRSAFTCFTIGGIDCASKPFAKRVSVDSGKVQALWCGVQIPAAARPGLYSGSVLVTSPGREQMQVPLQIQVSEGSVAWGGDDEPQRLSRLRWLNSKLAVDDSLVAPFTPVQTRGNAISLLGRRITLDQTGLPESIESYFTEEMTSIGTTPREILAGPVEILVEDSTGGVMQFEKTGLRFIKQAPGVVAWGVSNQAGDLTMGLFGSAEFDGTIEYTVALQTAVPVRLNDIRLRIPMVPAAAKYMMGLGFKGGLRPKAIAWTWDRARNQDGAWIGDINAGLQFGLKDENYVRPLNTNFYQLKPLVMPVSWSNGGKGGIRISDGAGEVVASAFSGQRLLEPGEILHFNFRLVVTPFKPIDTRAQWQTRYYHRFDPLDTIAATGANTINVHHATPINPFINYPFLRPEAMKAYADSAHARGMKMKIYYTVRELTNRAPELFALRSLGDEIFAHGSGGGFSWLQEHLGSDYIAAWFVPELNDAAIVNSGVSRWHNFYVEGLAWLVRNVGIDGLYLDDVAFDRLTMKRIRKVLDRGRSGSLIDLHSANQYNIRDGFANSANLYLEHFPFINRLWFGEYFDYDLPPDFWMTEVSGIPFGLMGEMLEKGGNPWRGMLYGMTSRLPWAGDPRPLWKVWDTFGMADSRMIGYWVSNNPVQTDNDSVLATVYMRKGSVLVSIASWARERQIIRLRFDWNTLGLNPQKAKIVAPEIEQFQPGVEFPADQPIPVEPGKGWLLIVDQQRGL